MNPDTLKTGILSEEMIRGAFRDWNSLRALGNHPLANLDIVENCRQTAGYTPTPMGLGLALRKVLQSAIDALKPKGESPELDEKDWRRFLILQEQYVHGRSPEWVAEQLHISKGTYYGEQKRALRMLADILSKWEEEQPHRPPSDVPPRPEPPQAAPSPPFMAPARPPHVLVGRDKLLRDLVLRLKSDVNRGLIVLTGLPGVGKTTAAIEVAHHSEILEHFQDGVLWASLGRQPDIATLLGRWAAAVGVPSNVIAGRTPYGTAPAPSDVIASRTPYGTAPVQSDVIVGRTPYGTAPVQFDVIIERAAAIHTAIGRRRMLLIIDDAWQTDAALAFKVGGPNCAHLLTTRLANVALDFAGDQVIAVHELDVSDGLNLLRQMATLAVEADPDAARSLVQMVGGLPLALILMGQHLQKQSYHAQPRRMRDALAELQIAGTRLELAQPQSALEQRADLPPSTPLTLRTVIGLSDTAPEDTAHQALVALALFAPKPNTFSEEAALAVTQAPAKVLDTLTDCGLVESVAPDRYAIHQTIADYASLQEAEPAVIERMVNYFVRFVETHASDHQALDLELENILTSAEAAFKSNLRDQLIRLTDALYSFLELRGLCQIAERLLSQANTVASAIGDSKSQAMCLYRLGEIEIKQGKFGKAKTYLEQGVDIARAAQLPYLERVALLQKGFAFMFHTYDGRPYLEEALTLTREQGDPEVESYALNALGFVYSELCDYSQALAYLEQALRVAQKHGIRRCEGWVDYNMGLVFLPMGEFVRAKEHFERSLQIYGEVGDRRGQAWDIYSFGRVFRQWGQYDAAQASFEQGLNIFKEIGDLLGQGFSVHNLGLVSSELGDQETALGKFEQAMDLFRKLSYQPGEGATFKSLGVLQIRQGDYAGAKAYLERALQCHIRLRYPRGESKDRAYLGLVCHNLGDEQAALEYSQQAVRIAREVGVRPGLALALTCLGRILADRGQLDEAIVAYRQALDLRRELGQAHRALDPSAGLAQVLLIREELPQAKTVVEEILDYLEANVSAAGSGYGLAGTDDPGQVYLTCYRVLQASQEPRAQAVLQTGKNVLQERAAKVADEKQRRSFLENVPAHREIMESSRSGDLLVGRQ